MALPHSDAFHAAMLAGAPFKTRATVRRQGKTIFGPEGIFLSQPTIDCDEFAASRRVLHASIPDVDGLLRPLFATSSFAPFGSELVVSAGLDVGAGVYEFVQLGVFRLLVTKTDSSTAMMSVEGQDRSWPISSQTDENPHVIAAGSTLPAAILSWAQEKIPDVVMLTDGTAASQIIASQLVFEEGATSGDPFQNMRDLARMFGRELFFDVYGRLVLRLIPTQTGAPYAATYTPGDMNVAINSSVTMDVRGVFNVVKITAQGSSLNESLVGKAEVTDRGDPMFAGVGSLVGRLIYETTTSALDSQAAVDAAAAATLVQKKGISQGVSVTIAPVLIHEPGDVVAYSSEREGIKGVYALSRFSLPLDYARSVAVQTRVLTQVA